MLFSNWTSFVGMNFYDFFAFVSRFTLLNVVQLFQLLRDSENPIWSSSPIAQHLALNLVSIGKIALKMKCVGVPSGNFGFLVDVRETLDDPEFFKLCIGFSRTYEMVHKLQKQSCESKKSLMVDLEGYGYLISTPEDLIKLIDYATRKLSGNCSEENILLPKFDDARLWRSVIANVLPQFNKLLKFCNDDILISIFVGGFGREGRLTIRL